MEISRTIRLPEWNETVVLKMNEYWLGRGVVLRQIDDTQWTGRRGSVWGSFWSFHIAKAVTGVSVVRCGSGLECTMDLDTRLRGCTPHRRSYLQIEMAEFESYLQVGDLQPEAYDAHRRAAASAMGGFMLMAFRSAYLGRGPLPVGGHMGLWARYMLAIGGALALVTLWLGPTLMPWFGYWMSGQTIRPSGAFERILFGPVMATLYGATFALIALWMSRLAHASGACVSVAQAADTLGVEADALEGSVRATGVEPRFIRDGEPVYDLGDITCAYRLVRPASAPDAATLLRPVGPASPGSDDRLVRPAAASGSPAEPGVGLTTTESGGDRTATQERQLTAKAEE